MREVEEHEVEDLFEGDVNPIKKGATYTLRGEDTRDKWR
jgi:hypothetical protein